ALEAAGEMPAVLDRPQQLLVMPPRPVEECEMISGRCRDRLRRALTSLCVDGNDGVRVLVRVDPDDHHEPCLLRSTGEARTGRRADPSRGDTTLLSSHAGRSVTASRAARRTQATKAQNAGERARKAG